MLQLWGDWSLTAECPNTRHDKKKFLNHKRDKSYVTSSQKASEVQRALQPRTKALTLAGAIHHLALTLITTHSWQLAEDLMGKLTLGRAVWNLGMDLVFVHYIA